MKKEGVMLDEWGGGENQEGDEEKKTDDNIFFWKKTYFQLKQNKRITVVQTESFMLKEPQVYTEWSYWFLLSDRLDDILWRPNMQNWK